MLLHLKVNVEWKPNKVSLLNEKIQEKLRRYALTKGNQEKTDRQSQTVTDSRRQSQTVADSHRQSQTITDSHRHSQTVTDSHR